MLALIENEQISPKRNKRNVLVYVWRAEHIYLCWKAFEHFYQRVTWCGTHIMCPFSDISANTELVFGLVWISVSLKSESCRISYATTFNLHTVCYILLPTLVEIHSFIHIYYYDLSIPNYLEWFIFCLKGRYLLKSIGNIIFIRFQIDFNE